MCGTQEETVVTRKLSCLSRCCWDRTKKMHVSHSVLLSRIHVLSTDINSYKAPVTFSIILSNVIEKISYQCIELQDCVLLLPIHTYTVQYIQFICNYDMRRLWKEETHCLIITLLFTFFLSKKRAKKKED